ncbi:major facilitator superfamily domain-containing protein [Parachaetomium inaequale]|uniref:Major facilitator superfamily domain-containing protein n=1 Tax=Parachaetomium inaequale TaxID=2588326 RepID=A0AAN6PSG6_9PEZI|nr:major facilitator superfamily domain-containing protein [Parachaetomium inaequale]
MLKNSTLSSKTGLQDGVKKAPPVVVEPLGTDECDIGQEGRAEVNPVKRPTTSGGADPLLGKAGPATASAGAVSPSDPDEHCPDGGIRAWLVVFGCWLALFASLGFMNVLATFQTYVTTNQTIHLGSSAVGATIFGYASLSFLLGIYVGPLFDKYGTRWLLLAGTICLAASLLLGSLSTEPAAILAALGILGSLGSTLLFTPAIAAISHIFTARRRGLATGIATTASSASAVVFPFLLQALFVRVGWAWTVRALALLCLALAVAANFFIRSSLHPARAAAVTTQEDSSSSPHPHARVFRTRGFTLTVVAVSCAQLAASLPLSYMSAYVLGRGFSHAESFEVVAIVNASSAVGRVALGWAADRVGPFNASVACAAVAALACFGVWLPAGGTKAGVVVFALVFGGVSGGGVCLAPVAVGRLCKTGEFGRYYGACYTIASLLVVLAVPVVEQVARSRGGDYLGLVLATGVLYLAAAVAFAAARVAVVGRGVWTTF